MKCTRTPLIQDILVCSFQFIPPVVVFIWGDFCVRLGYVNFTKRAHIAGVMKTILEQQGGEYPLQSIDCIQEWVASRLEKEGAKTEDDLFKMSLEAEPREG